MKADKTKKVKTTKKKKEKNSDTDIKNISKLLYDRTQAWAKSQGLLEDKKQKYSTKVKKFDSIISSGNFGCQEKYVREIVSELIGEKLPPMKNSEFNIDFKLGVVIVPLMGVHSSYTIGDPLLITDVAGFGTHLDGNQPCNKLNPSSKKSIRPATIEEIEVLVETILQKDEFVIKILGFIFRSIGD